MNFFKYLTEEQQASVLAKYERRRQRKRQLESINERIVSFRKAGVSVHAIQTAHVYIIMNESFPDWYKIGTCVDLNKRVQSYQTSDPLKGYKVIDSWIIRDRHSIEKEFLLHVKQKLSLEVNGEWVYTTDYKALKKAFNNFKSCWKNKR